MGSPEVLTFFGGKAPSALAAGALILESGKWIWYTWPEPLCKPSGDCAATTAPWGDKPPLAMTAYKQSPDCILMPGLLPACYKLFQGLYSPSRSACL